MRKRKTELEIYCEAHPDCNNEGIYRRLICILGNLFINETRAAVKKAIQSGKLPISGPKKPRLLGKKSQELLYDFAGVDLP